MAYIKGLIYALVGWLGIIVLESDGSVLIRIPADSPGYYLLIFLNFFSLFYGIYLIYRMCKVSIRKAIRCYQAKNYRNIKKRIENAGKRNQTR